MALSRRPFGTVQGSHYPPPHAIWHTLHGEGDGGYPYLRVWTRIADANGTHSHGEWRDLQNSNPHKGPWWPGLPQTNTRA